MTLDLAPVIDRTEAWLKRYPPNTGYTIGVLNLLKHKLDNEEFPEGMNIVIQHMLQYTGIEEFGDVTTWDPQWPEVRLPYSQTSRYSPDKSMDCSSFPLFIYKVWFNKYIGVYTEAQYYQIPKIGGYAVDWSKRRPLDLIQYLMPSSTHKHVSHDATYIGSGKILHTRSSKNPMIVESDSYRRQYVKKVWRILSDEEYKSTFIGKISTKPDPPIEPPQYTRLLKYIPGEIPQSGIDVWWVELRLQKKMQGIYFIDRDNNWYSVPYKINGYYGNVDEGCVYNYQTRNPDCGHPDGIVGPKTWASLAKD